MTFDHSVRLEVDQNPYLPVGGRQVNAILSVVVDDGPPSLRPPSVAQVLIIDGSASMAFPPTKLPEAKRATSAAIDALRDDAAFAVVVGNDTATQVYPPGGGLAPATLKARQAARRAVEGVVADGGTRIGRWLTAATAILTSHPADIKHVILLTDGRNDRESQAELSEALQACTGAFVCDCRGIGRDWRGEELLMIADALGGTADGMTSLGQLADDFRAMTAQVMGKLLPSLAIRLWTPAGSAIRYLKEVHPRILDLTGRRETIERRVGAYPIGAWGTERRDYHVCIEVEAGEPGEEMLAGRVSIVGENTVYAEERVLAIWTEDEELATQVSRRVEHYTVQAELADEIQSGMAARRHGNEEVATAKLLRAMAMADEIGDVGTARSLAQLVDVDEERGTARLVRRADNADVDLAAEVATVRSTRTVRGPARSDDDT